MAQVQNVTLPPNISIPQTLLLFISAFTVTSEKEAILIFEQAVKTLGCNSNIKKKDLQSSYALFRIINPQDNFERVWCAQYIISHLLGVHSLSLTSHKDKRIGLKLLKAAEAAMERIQNKRNGTMSENHVKKEKK